MDLNPIAEEVHPPHSQLVRAFDANYGISPSELRRQVAASQAGG